MIAADEQPRACETSDQVNPANFFSFGTCHVSHPHVIFYEIIFLVDKTLI